jgi:hypothetical protein
MSVKLCEDPCIYSATGTEHGSNVSIGRDRAVKEFTRTPHRVGLLLGLKCGCSCPLHGLHLLLEAVQPIFFLVVRSADMRTAQQTSTYCEMPRIHIILFGHKAMYCKNMGTPRKRRLR